MLSVTCYAEGMSRVIELLQEGYSHRKVVTLTESTPSHVRDAQRVLGFVPHANGAGVYPVYDMLEEIARLLNQGRPRQWVARELGVPNEAVNSADRFMGTGGRYLRNWSLKTYDWVERCLNKGMTLSQVAYATRTHHVSIKRWFPFGLALGVSRDSHLEPHDWPDVEVLAMKNHTTTQISEALDIPVQVVRLALHDIGYPKGALE